MFRSLSLCNVPNDISRFYHMTLWQIKKIVRSKEQQRDRDPTVGDKI